MHICCTYLLTYTDQYFKHSNVSTRKQLVFFNEIKMVAVVLKCWFKQVSWIKCKELILANPVYNEYYHTEFS
jgi:hypothetical protein